MLFRGQDTFVSATGSCAVVSDQGVQKQLRKTLSDQFSLSQGQPSTIQASEMTGTNYVLGRPYTICAAILCAAATMLTLVFISIAGVNVPFSDEWWNAGLVKAVRSGTATLGTFWSPANEHRMLIPRLEFALLAILTHWNSKIIMLAAWLVMAIAAAFLYAQFKTIYTRAHPILWTLSTFLSVAVLLSLVQLENWLWAYQFAFFFVQFSVLVSVFVLCRSDRSLASRLVIAITLAVAASYSSAQGLLIWPALLLSLCLTNDSLSHKIGGVFWLGISALATIGIYFFGLSRSANLQIRPDQITGKPQLPIVGFLGLAGNSLAGWISFEHRPHRAWLIGLAMTAVLLALILIIIRRRKIPQAAPWLGLAVFSYSFCLVTTYGRLGLGYTGGFLASRYTTHVTFLVVALLALLLLAVNSAPTGMAKGKSTENRLKAALPYCLIFAIGTFVFIGNVRAFITSMKEREDRLLARELIPFYSYFDPKVDGEIGGPFFPLCPLRSTKIVDIGLKPLVDEGYFRRLDPVAFVEGQSGISGQYSVSLKLEEHRYLRIVRLGWMLKGNVIIDTNADVDLVFVKPNGIAGFIGAAKLKPATADKGSEKICEWSLFLSPPLFPDRSIPLEMWIFDRRANQFIKVTS